jgi:hypothetical protein
MSGYDRNLVGLLTSIGGFGTRACLSVMHYFNLLFQKWLDEQMFNFFVSIMTTRNQLPN